MKKVISSIAAGVFFLAQAGYVLAETKTYTVTAKIPVSSAVSINAFRITNPGNVKTAVDGNVLSFDPLLYQAGLGIYLPDHYFVIESGLAVGAGNQDVTVAYTEGANPNSPGHGLGWKTTATFSKLTGPTTEEIIASHGKKMLKDITAEHVTPSELGNNLLKIYVGVVTKDPSAVPADPELSEVITNADKPGVYDGTLTVTATVV